MAINKKGQAMLFGLMIAAFVFVAAVVLIAPLKDNITIARDAAHLDCTNTSISTGTAATCLIVDLYLLYFIGVVLVGSVGYILVRKVT